MTTLPVIQDAACSVPAALGPHLAAAVNYAKAEKSPATRKAYGSDFKLFKAWCDGKGAQAFAGGSRDGGGIPGGGGRGRRETFNTGPARCGNPICPQAGEPGDAN